VLGLLLIDVSHNGQNIVDHVDGVVADYGLTNKVFAVTLDNASSNVSAMRLLRLILSPYLGIDNVDNGDESQTSISMFLHQCCACHVINLIVKEALGAFNYLIETFRTTIFFKTLLIRELLHIKVIALLLILGLENLSWTWRLGGTLHI
jgi:hypothetical protein